MRGYSRVILVGNLTRDPEVRKIPSGTSVVDLGLAINETYRTREGKNVESVCFVDITAWGRQADTCGQHLAKGCRVLVDGRLVFDQWTSQQGEKRTKLKVRADRVRFMDSRNGNGTNGDGDLNAQVRDEVPAEAMPF